MISEIGADNVDKRVPITIHRFDESFQAQSQAHVDGVAIQEPIAKVTRPLPVVEGKDAETGADTDKTNSEGDTEILQIDEEQGKYMDNQVNLKEKTDELDQGQAGSDPGKTPESRPQLEQEFMDEDQAGPDPGEPLSSSETLSLMKNLDDAYTIGDQFLNDKSTKDEPGKLNVDLEVVSMVTVLIHQASSSVTSLSTPIIDLSPPKPVSSTTQAPIFTPITTTTTTTLPLPPPLP
nr:hypothetical protein [Tanacetum cinerariifolium]